MRSGANLKKAIREGVPTIGSWMTLGSQAVAEIMVNAGFEWVVIDLEHSVIGLDTAEALMRAIEGGGASPLVRLTSNDPAQAKRVMDAGAHGIIVPMVNTAADAVQAAAMVRYPPAGTRGVGLARAQKYSHDGFREYAARINDDVIVIAQIEHKDAIANLESILDVPGIDATIIGPYDLSASFGLPGQYNDPAVAGALERYESISRARRRTMGYHVIEPKADALNARISRGYTFAAFSTDFLFLGETVRTELRNARTSMAGTSRA
jgi:2-dehydro-3-deoxyglucarate aldolase